VPPPRYSGVEVVRRKDNRLNLGFLGRHDRQKGLDFLLDFLDRHKDLPVHLWVAGEEDREATKTKAARENVTFLGWIDSLLVDDFIQGVDALIAPSRWEGFGLVVLEAMRNGRPVLVSDRGALAEHVVHGYNGYVFSIDFDDDLLSILNGLTRDIAREIGKNALECFNKMPDLQVNFSSVDNLYVN